MKDKKMVIDFKKTDWTKIDREKAVFFYNQAAEYNNALIANISGLNSKAFSLPAMALPLLSAAAGLLPAVREKGGNTALILTLACAAFSFTVTAALLLLAVFPRHVYLSGGTPARFFTGNFYKADMLRQISFGIASLNKYITHNEAVERFRSRFLMAGMAAFFAAPLVTAAAFLIHCLYW